ncbi:MAG: hypothetical protein ACOXZM_10195 [Eubacteriales bacterium]|jgi:hypothetical protein
MPFLVISFVFRFLVVGKETRRLRILGEIALPAFAHKKSFLPGVAERKEKEPHEGGHRIRADKAEARLNETLSHAASG